MRDKSNRRFLRWAKYDRVSGVYIVSFGIYAKIGWSTRIGARLREIEDGTPEQLNLHRVFVGDDHKYERRLHAQFSEFRIRNEWFRFEGALRAFAGYEPMPSLIEARMKMAMREPPKLRIVK